MSRTSTMLERVRATPGLRRDLLVVVATVALGLVVAGVILAQQRFSWPWQDAYTFQAAFTEVPGISPGNGQEVRVAGVPSGWITGAEVSDDGRAVLTMELDREVGPVHDNAHLVLRPKSPLNEMYVELDPGGAPGSPLADGDVVPATQTTRPVQVEEPLTHLDATARTALRSLLAESDAALANAGNDLPAGIEQLTSTTRGLQPVVEALDQRRALVRDLVASLSDVAAAAGADNERIHELVSAATTTLQTLDGNDDALRASLRELPGVTDGLADTAESVTRLTSELDPALDGIAAGAQDLPRALRRLDGLVGQLDDTLDEAAPLLASARPLLADLRPLVGDVRPAVGDLRAVVPGLTPLTADLVSNLGKLQDFVYNTESVVSTEDANGPILRGLLVVSEKAQPIIPGDVPVEEVVAR